MLIPFCNHLASHRRILRANDRLADASSEATAAAVAKNGAVVDDELVDDELDEVFSVVRLVYSSGEMTGLSRLHGDIQGVILDNVSRTNNNLVTITFVSEAAVIRSETRGYRVTSLTPVRAIKQASKHIHVRNRTRGRDLFAFYIALWPRKSVKTRSHIRHIISNLQENHSILSSMVSRWTGAKSSTNHPSNESYEY